MFPTGGNLVRRPWEDVGVRGRSGVRVTGVSCRWGGGEYLLFGLCRVRGGGEVVVCGCVRLEGRGVVVVCVGVRLNGRCVMGVVGDGVVVVVVVVVVEGVRDAIIGLVL